jgi:hypothetical protein
MSIETIARDIRRYAKLKLDEHQIVVVPMPTNDPDLEDDTIEFVRKDERKLTFSLQVSSLSSGHWDDAIGQQSLFEVKALSDTGFSQHSLEALQPINLTGSTEQRVAKIVAQLEATSYELEPVDSIEDKVITNSIAEDVVKALGEVREMLAGISDIKVAFADNNILEFTLNCDDTPFIEVRVQEYRATITNALRNETTNAAGVDSIQEAIKEMALASYSPDPSI